MSINKDAVKSAFEKNVPNNPNMRIAISGMLDNAPREDGFVTLEGQPGPGSLGSLCLQKQVPPGWFKGGKDVPKDGNAIPSLMPIFEEYGFTTPGEVGSFADGYARSETLKPADPDHRAAYEFGLSLSA